MNVIHYLYLSILIILSACNFGSLPDKDLSCENIESVELTTPTSTESQVIRLNTNQVKLFCIILEERNNKFVEPSTCYYVHIKLRDGSAVQYITDGINFQGVDDSTDRPFSFAVDRNILKEVLELKDIQECK